MAISTTHDIVPDSPTNVFAALNPLVLSNSALSDGNLKIVIPNALTNNVLSTIQFPNEGKWFFEILYISYLHHNSGIINKSTNTTYTVYQNGFYTNSANPSTLSTNSYSASSNSVIGLLINFENVQATVTIYINGTSVGGPYNITSGEYSAVFNDGASATGGTQIINFGQDHLFGGATLPSGAGSNTPDNGIGTFAFSVPSGAKALCTANLPDPAIDPAVDDLPEDYMKVVKYIGDNATWQDNPDGQDVTVGFQPDLVWWKNRDSSVAGHYISDTVRGITEILNPSSTNGQTAFDTTHKQSYGYITQVNSNGFRIAKGTTTAAVETNSSSNNYIAWCFRAGGSPSATDDGTGVSGSAKLVDTSGTASSTTCKSFKDAAVTAGASNVICPSKMSINQKAGFSIIRYPNGVSVPHGLSKAPEFFITKSIGSTSDWVVYHKDATPANTQYITLNSASAVVTSNSNLRGFAPTNFVFSNFDSGNVFGGMGANVDMIAYCWHSVAGFSAFGSYTGNGSADGPFVYTGFKPAWVMVKATNLNGSSWFVWDNQRSPYNEMVNALLPNDSIQELTDREMDFLSNGFKPRANDGNYNQNYTYIYAAFAEMPFKYATAR